MALSPLYTSDGSRIYTSDGSPIFVYVADALNLTCPGNVTVITPINTAQIVTFAEPTVTGGVEPFTITCTPASGSSFSVGTTTVNCSVEDAIGATDTCSFTVTLTASLAAGCTTALSNEFNRG